MNFRCQQCFNAEELPIEMIQAHLELYHAGRQMVSFVISGGSKEIKVPQLQAHAVAMNN